MKKLILLFVLLIAANLQAQKGITQYSSITSGTLTCTNTQQDLMVIHEAGLTLSMTFAFPANPADGQAVTLISPGGITSLNITATVGSVINAITGMVAGSPATYIYYLSTNKWYRIR